MSFNSYRIYVLTNKNVSISYGRDKDKDYLEAGEMWIWKRVSGNRKFTRLQRKEE